MRKAREVILALRVEEREIAHRAELELALREGERLARGGLGARLGLKRARVVVERAQRVGDVLEGEQHGLPILRGGLVVGPADDLQRQR